MPKPLLIKELFLSTLSLPYCSRSQFILVYFIVKMSRIKTAQSQVLAVPSFLWTQSWGVWGTAGSADFHWCWPWLSSGALPTKQVFLELGMWFGGSGEFRMSITSKDLTATMAPLPPLYNKEPTEKLWPRKYFRSSSKHLHDMTVHLEHPTLNDLKVWKQN